MLQPPPQNLVANDRAIYWLLMANLVGTVVQITISLMAIRF
jgi:hypothetical protein